jgi:hypothetical protein
MLPSGTSEKKVISQMKKKEDEVGIERMRRPTKFGEE